MTLTKKMFVAAVATIALSVASMAATSGAFAKGGGGGKGVGHHGPSGGKGMGRHHGPGGHFRHSGHRFRGHVYSRYNGCWKRTRHGLVNVCELDD